MIDPRHHRALTELAAALPDRPLVVIGAAALAWHFGRSFRATLDLDLCLAIDLAEHVRGTSFPASWHRAGTPPHRWRLPDGTLVDVLPAAAELLAAGTATWPDGVVFDLTGIDLAMQDAARCAPDLPPTVGVASRRALFVMKATSWLDRPGDRFKDLGDLCLLLGRYVEADDPRCFGDPSLDPQREFDERSAFLLGVDLRPLCTARHLDRLSEFVARVGEPDRVEHHWMAKAAPGSWQQDETAVRRRIAALRAGLGL